MMDIKELKKEIVSVDEAVLERCLQILMEKNEEHHKMIANELQKSLLCAKEAAGKVISEAADYASEQVNVGATAALDEMSAVMKEAKADILNSSIAVMKETVFAMKISCAAAILTAVIFAGSLITTAP